MQEFLNLLKSMPEYVKGLFMDHLIVACIAAVVFIFVLFFSNKVANTIRTFFYFGRTGTWRNRICYQETCFAVPVYYYTDYSDYHSTD